MNTKMFSGHLKDTYVEAAAGEPGFGSDGTKKFAYKGPVLQYDGYQWGAFRSLVQKPLVIYLYPTWEQYPHYSLVDGNPHYTDENERHHTIDNQNVITYLQQHGEYQLQGGGARKKRKKRKTRRKRNKRKTNKRRK